MSAASNASARRRDHAGDTQHRENVTRRGSGGQLRRESGLRRARRASGDGGASGCGEMTKCRSG